MQIHYTNSLCKSSDEVYTRTCAARAWAHCIFRLLSIAHYSNTAIVSLIKVIPCNRSIHRKWLRDLHWPMAAGVVWVRRGALSMTDEWLYERTNEWIFYSRKHDPENSQMNIEHMNLASATVWCVRRTVALAKRNEKRMECIRETTHRLPKAIKARAPCIPEDEWKPSNESHIQRLKTWFSTRGQSEFSDWFIKWMSPSRRTANSRAWSVYNSSFLLRGRTCRMRYLVRRSIARAISSRRYASKFRFAKCTGQWQRHF